MTPPLMLLDAAGLWFRSYYAMPDSLTTPDGTPVGAVRGFADTVANLVTDRRPSRLVACLDADWRPEFRVRALPSYKTHRVADESADDGAEEVPDTLSPQIPIILEVLDAAGIATAEADGYEADDVIGTLSTTENTDPVRVITGDRDLFQLVREHPTEVRVIYIGGGLAKAQDFGTTELAERYSLPSGDPGFAYAEMAILRGDPSDGLPGVAGIGEKTAAKLLREFETLAALRAAAVAGDRRIAGRARQNLMEGADYLDAADTVVHVVRDAPVQLDREDRLPRGVVDRERLEQLQRRWGLGGSIDRLVTALGG